jgi:hypothetical protein
VVDKRRETMTAKKKARVRPSVADEGDKLQYIAVSVQTAAQLASLVSSLGRGVLAMAEKIGADTDEVIQLCTQADQVAANLKVLSELQSGVARGPAVKPPAKHEFSEP